MQPFKVCWWSDKAHEYSTLGDVINNYHTSVYAVTMACNVVNVSFINIPKVCTH